MSEPIYLDHNSTTPIDPMVAQEIAACYAAGYMNPASQHRSGQRARRKLEQIRHAIAKLLGANCVGMQTDQLIFTSGGTESNNLALIGLAQAASAQSDAGRKDKGEARGRVLISAIEHPSVIGAAEQLARLGFQVEKIPVDQHGVCRLDTLQEMLEVPTNLVSLMLANNETGVLQPVGQVAAICRDRGILLHTDAVQVVGKIPVHFRDLDVDAMTFSAHKFHGPRGIGGLMLRHGVIPQPIHLGGFQQMGIRPGTEDVALAAGMCKALELFHEDPSGRFESLRKMRDQMQLELQAEFPEMVVNGMGAERVAHTLNVSFPGVDRQSFLLAADLAGLAISTGSACASGSSELSPVLLAMDLDKQVVEGSIRISLGATNSQAQVESATQRISQIVREIRGRNSAESSG